MHNRDSASNGSNGSHATQVSREDEERRPASVAPDGSAWS